MNPSKLLPYAITLVALAATLPATARDSLWWELRVYQAPTFTIHDEDGPVTIDTTSTQTGLTVIPLSKESKAIVDDKIITLDAQRSDVIVINDPEVQAIYRGHNMSSVGHSLEINVKPKEPWKYMELIPETSPQQYTLRETAPDSIFSLSVATDYADKTKSSLAIASNITQTLPYKREALPGVDHDAGRILFEEHADTTDFTMNIGQWYALVWQRSGQQPLVSFLRVYNDELLNEKSRIYSEYVTEYSIESKIMLVKGRLDPEVSLAAPDDGNTRNRFGKRGRPDNVQVIDGDVIPVDAWSVFEGATDLRNRNIKGFKRVRDTELISAPRVTSFFADPAGVNPAVKTLFKMVLANPVEPAGGRGGGRERHHREVTNVSDMLEQIMTDRHDFYDPETHIGKDNKWAIVADLTTQYVRDPGHSDSFTQLYDGILIIVTAYYSEDPETIPIDYAFLGMEIEKDHQHDHYFRVKYDTEDGETVAFYLQKSDTEHYFIFNTLTLIDRSGRLRDSE